MIFSYLFLKLRMWLSVNDNSYYINGSETLPAPLSAKEERKIMERIIAGDENAREPLIVHNLRLVVYIAKKFESSNVYLEDLI